MTSWVLSSVLNKDADSFVLLKIILALSKELIRAISLAALSDSLDV